ncbi:MAG: tRNA threonylcarbamoyladenosine dehydratase [Proteobacteria bacterium]|nr:tRNA threonylcarbamoyladenosine dehydratase [Pseudomonadota bacterium]
MATNNKQDFTRRFSGIAKLYSNQGLERFQQSHVVVIGVGGVGSWAVESLARSGIGQLTLIDLDHLSESNINRQLPALSSTLGQAKVQALKNRISEINAECKVNCVEEFISTDNVPDLLGHLVNNPLALVIDCIDHAKTKAALIAWCRQQKLLVLTVGAAGSCVDPLRINIGDLSRTQNDGLLARTRKHLRQIHNYPRNLKRRFCVPAVYSDEKRLEIPDDQCEAGQPTASDLNCAGYGSVVHVTATFGFIAAGKALEMLRARP